MAIMNALRRHKAEVRVTVDGLAASAASFIAMAGDHITMNRGSELMIHDAWGFAQGDAKTMREMSESLDKTSAAIAALYAQRAGGTADEWRELMLAETWYSAEEAVAAGLADEWEDAPDASNGPMPEAQFDLSRFAYAGRSVAPAPRAAVHNPPASEPVASQEGDEMALRDDLIERLGLDAEATDEQILEAVDAELEDDNGDDGGDGDGSGDDGSAARLPDGVVAIDASVLEQLQGDARAGREALTNQATERRNAAISDAIRTGRITAAARDTWAARMAADESGTVALLGTLAAGSAAPMAEVGHSDEPENADEALYAKAWGSNEKEA